jgi:hypothetical protein
MAWKDMMAKLIGGTLHSVAFWFFPFLGVVIMGKCKIVIEATGANHNKKPYDIDQMAREFILDLKFAGHTVGVGTCSTGAGEENLLLIESGAVGDEVGSLMDGFLKGLLNQISFNGKAFIKHPKFKEGLQCFAIAAKDAATAPGGLDDFAIDQIQNVLLGIIDQQQLEGPIEVGAAGPTGASRKRAKKLRNEQEVIDEIIKLGGDPKDEKKFSPLLIGLLTYLPNFIQFLMTLMGK